MRQTYVDCETCELVKCPEECFNRHVGSMIALKKLTDSMGVKATIIDETGRVMSHGFKESVRVCRV